MSFDRRSTLAPPPLPGRQSFRFLREASATKIQLYGRADKEQALLDAYEQATSSDTSDHHYQSLVFIEGEPGTGKTSLANTLRSHVQRDNGFFVSGKFPPILRGEPYSVFVSALGEYTDKLLRRTQQQRDSHTVLQRHLQDAITRPEDQALLRNIIPAVDRVLGTDEEEEENQNRSRRRHKSSTALMRDMSSHGGSRSRRSRSARFSKTRTGSTPVDPHEHEEQPSSQALHRFHYIVCTYIYTLLECGGGGPLVLFLDDLHWADTASLELLRALCGWNVNKKNDSTRRAPLVLLGAHRRIAKEDTRPFVAALASIQARMLHEEGDGDTSSTQGPQPPPLRHHMYTWPPVHFRYIPLDNLDPKSVQEMIRDALDLNTASDEDVTAHLESLATVVYERTEGNAFYVLHFLKFLEDQQLLTQDSETDIWTWNDATIRDSLDTEDTVIDLLANKMKSRLDHDEQAVLKVAACMGKELDDSALALIMGKTSPTGKNGDSGTALVPRALDAAENAGFLVFVPHAGGYQFVHDHMQHAAFSLIPEEAQAAFQWDIGRKLWKASSEQALRANIFVVVNLLHGALGAGTVTLTRNVRQSVADLHLTAGERAVAMSAFPDAALYFARGIEWLPESAWEANYGLTLALHTGTAEVEVCNGNFDHVKQLIRIVFQHASCLEDKFRCYITLIVSMGQQGNVQEAQRVAFEVLQGLGERFPPRATKMAIFRDYLRTKRAMRSKSDADFLKLPLMTDITKLCAGRILALVFRYLYMARSPYTLLVTFRMLRLCLKFGRFDGSALAFVQYAMVVGSVMGDTAAGCRFGKLAMSLLESEPRKSFWLAQVYLAYYGFIDHFAFPLRNSLDSLKYGASNALAMGNREISMMNALVYCFYLYYSGASIELVRQELSIYAQYMSLYKQENVLLLIGPLQQVLENVNGRAPNPAMLRGAMFDKEQALKDADVHGVELLTLTWLYFAVDVAVLFRDFERAFDLCQQFRNSKQHPTADFGYTKFLVDESLSIMAMAHLCRHDVRKSVKHAKRSIKQFGKWVSFSPENFGFRKLLLEAELGSLEGPSRMDESTVRALYRKAIDEAKREGFTHDAAIACERAGDHLRRTDAPPDEAMALYHEARDLYARWGAPAKVSQLSNEVIDN